MESRDYLEIRGVSREKIRAENEQNAESNLSIGVDSSSSKTNKSATKKEKRKTKARKIKELDEFKIKVDRELKNAKSYKNYVNGLEQRNYRLNEEVKRLKNLL